MDIEKLAEMTAKEFTAVHSEIGGVKNRLDHLEDQVGQLVQGQARLETSVKAVLDVVLEIPTKKVFEKLAHKVEDIDERVTVVEHKLQTVH